MSRYFSCLCPGVLGESEPARPLGPPIDPDAILWKKLAKKLDEMKR